MSEGVNRTYSDEINRRGQNFYGTGITQHALDLAKAYKRTIKSLPREILDKIDTEKLDRALRKL